jgi:hypothetical protein
MPEGFALEAASSIEVIAAYSAAPATIQSVAATPGWHVVGEFYLPKSCDARLDVILSVSDSSLVARARLYDLGATPPAAVSGTVVSTSSETPSRLLSGVVTLTGSRRYQIQVECTGGTAETDFAVFQTGTITD